MKGAAFAVPQSGPTCRPPRDARRREKWRNGRRNGTRLSRRFGFYFFLTILAECPIGNWSNQLDLRCYLSSSQRGRGQCTDDGKWPLTGCEAGGYLQIYRRY